MKKNLTYRDRLLELAQIYNIAEIKNYTRAKKNLTVPQLELILRKNKVPIPKEINKSILEIQAEKIRKPFYSAGIKFNNNISSVNKITIKFFFTSIKKIFNFFGLIQSGILGFLLFISKTTVDLLNGIYNFKVQEKKANLVVTSLATVLFSIGIVWLTFSVLNHNVIIESKTIEKSKVEEKLSVTKEPPKEIRPKEKKVVKKLEKKAPPKESKPKEKKVVKKLKKKAPSKEIKPKENTTNEVAELVLPNLNLKTETVLSLFEDVKYDLKTVRFEKRVKPIYFTQFPKDLDEIQSIQLKKETFIKIVLPLVVAENEKILDDKFKLKKIIQKKMTTDKEKAWLRQKLLEYKVTNGNMDELTKRMDIIPVSIALAQAAKESGWGTSRFALEGNAIFGQWTWNGKGIAPKSRDIGQNHKILRFPILRASVKAYKKNLNTHKGYKKFRDKRAALSKRNKSAKGLDLIDTLENYAQTGAEYTKNLRSIIEQNNLADFESVKLTNSVIKKELNL